MMVKVYNQTGQETQETVELPEKLFGISEVKPEVVHQVAVSILSGRRNTVAHTKTKGEVRGGGRKPWKQKGTGRARAGSIRSPLWKGGGVTFGPRSNRNFYKKVNKKVARLGIFSVLTDKAKDNKIMVLDKLELATGKTKEIQKLLKSWEQLTAANSFIIILPRKDETIAKAVRNLKNVKIMPADNLNILDLLWANSIVILKEALEVLGKFYGHTQ